MLSGAEQEAKLGELILYIAERTGGDARGGATKLNKYLYFADFSAMRVLGHPITGVEYQKLPWGPAPRRLLRVRDGLVAAAAAVVERRSDPFGYVHDHLVARRPADMILFSVEERNVIDGVIDALREMTAGEVSDLSHREAGWQLVGDNETIPYELAFVRAPSELVVTPAARRRGEELLAQFADRIAR